MTSIVSRDTKETTNPRSVLDEWGISASEAAVLLEQNDVRGRTLKLAMLELAARGVVSVEWRHRRNIIGWRSRHPTMTLRQDRPALGPVLNQAFALVESAPARRFETGVATAVADVARETRRYSHGFAKDIVEPALVNSGLIEERVERGILGIKRRHLRRTERGEECATQLSDILRSLPSDIRGARGADAASLVRVAAAGTAALLLETQFPELQALSRERGDDALFVGGDGSGSSERSLGFPEIDFGVLEFGWLSELSDAFHAIDVGMDAGGGDGGSGDGGGDGGGGGD